MSSAEGPPSPHWAPPPEYRPHRAAYVFAVIMPIVLLGLLVAPLGIAWAVGRERGPVGTTSARAPAEDEGEPGVGDPYFPDYGSSGYDAHRYQIAMSWDPAQGEITAVTTITARATQALESFYVDLALDATRVQVDGRDASFRRRDFQDLQITPAAPIAAGAEFSITVDYGGEPAEVRRGRDQRAPWFTTNAEWTAAGEPESAAWWYPSNDHPSDPALMDVSVRVPAGMEAISVGRLESRDAAAEADFDTWHWVSREPMATYLNFVSIGQYEVREGTADGRPYVYAVSEQLSAEDRTRAFAALETSAAVVRVLEGMFGPYPFSELGGIVPAHRLWFAGLETQTRPIYDARSILEGDFAPELLAHELAHMWYGDNVTLRQWNDIFVNEAYAAWAQWGYRERTANRPANRRLNQTYDRTKDNAGFWQITMIDPGKDNLFSTVYVRGPMCVQALRNVMGDAAFFRLARAWGQDPGHRSLEEWMIKAQAETSVDLVPFFRAWIFSSTAPARTAANGFRD